MDLSRLMDLSMPTAENVLEIAMLKTIRSWLHVSRDEIVNNDGSHIVLECTFQVKVKRSGEILIASAWAVTYSLVDTFTIK